MGVMVSLAGMGSHDNCGGRAGRRMTRVGVIGTRGIGQWGFVKTTWAGKIGQGRCHGNHG